MNKTQATELEQEKLSVKLFSKRFKKLAKENLELNDCLKGKETTLTELNNHIESQTKRIRKFKKDIGFLKKLLIESQENLQKSESKIRDLSENLNFFKNLLKNLKNEIFAKDLTRKEPTYITNCNSDLISSLSLDAFGIGEASGDFSYSPSNDQSQIGKDSYISDEIPFRDLSYSAENLTPIIKKAKKT